MNSREFVSKFIRSHSLRIQTNQRDRTFTSFALIFDSQQAWLSWKSITHFDNNHNNQNQNSQLWENRANPYNFPGILTNENCVRLQLKFTVTWFSVRRLECWILKTSILHWLSIFTSFVQTRLLCKIIKYHTFVGFLCRMHLWFCLCCWYHFWCILGYNKH